MKLRSHVKRAFEKLSEIRRGRFHLLLLFSFFMPMFLILFLDFFNVEAFASFNRRFMFDLTWKGRMFYLFFMWLLLLESILDWERIVEKRFAFQNRFRAILACLFAAVPTVYILGVNFLGLKQMILDLGQAIQIRSGAIEGHWPLSIEYLVLTSFFLFAVWIAYGFAGLESFSISLSLLAGISAVYMIDTIWPYGTFEPMQSLALPTAACATALLDLLGYGVRLTFPYISSQEYGSLPRITVWRGEKFAVADVGWPCAGVHSLFLFTLITLLFFKKTTIQRERKMIFFLIGAAGTYLINIFRIISFLIIYMSHGRDAATVFHDYHGELYFIAWIALYFIIISAIESGKIGAFFQAFRRKSLSLMRILHRKSA